MKKIISFTIIIMLVFSLSACMTPRKTQWKPCNQPNTKWMSSDGKIVFYVDDYGVATGTICVDDSFIEVYIAEGPPRSVEMELFPLNVLEDEIISGADILELWLCSYRSEEEFVAQVKDTTFYERGRKFVFYKVE